MPESAKAMSYSSLAVYIIEMIGTVAFASSGAMIAIRKNMDIFGINVLAVTTALGGGPVSYTHLEALGTRETGAVRFSFGWFNTEGEIDIAVEAVKKIAQE